MTLKNLMPRDARAQTPLPGLPAGHPWNPTMWMIVALVGLAPIGIIGLALNWKRLGKPQWTSVTIFILLMLASLAIVSFIIVEKVEAAQSLDAVPFGIWLIGSITLTIAITDLQRTPYEIWNTEHDTAGMLAHIYNFKKALFQAIFLIVLGTGIGIFVMLTNRETFETFEDSALRVTYSSEWEAVEPSSQASCQQITGCFLYLIDTVSGPGGYAPMVVNEISFVEFMTSQPADVLRDNGWRQASLQNGVLRGQNMVQLGGLSAYTNEYLWPQPDDDALYVRQIYVANGSKGFLISVSSSNEEIARDSRAKIDKVLDSIEFK